MNKENNHGNSHDGQLPRDNSYADILLRPHHVSAVYPRMSMAARAAQFAPFAALPGHSDALMETARHTDHPDDLADDERARLDEELAAIMDTPHRMAIITYLEPDAHKSGGRIVTVSGSIVMADPVGSTITLSDGTHISMAMIRRITPIEP